LNNLVGDLKLENVAFAYPSRPDVDVLKGVSLNLEPGKIVALVGPSGQGKSTIASLLELFYYPTAGKITLGKFAVLQQ
jgi:ATP-binding cassette subfamily B (MDR/TAP) protein 8